VRLLIKSAIPLGFRPDDVRRMIPCDWMLVKQGYDEQAQAQKPGAAAPSDAEVAKLVERYG